MIHHLEYTRSSFDRARYEVPRHRFADLFTARVDARTNARVGDTIRLAVDPSRFYFFSPGTGESLLRAAA